MKRGVRSATTHLGLQLLPLLFPAADVLQCPSRILLRILRGMRDS